MAQDNDDVDPLQVGYSGGIVRHTIAS